MVLSPEQEAFLQHPPNRCARLLAGPGTGKSFTSVAYLERITADNPGLRVGYITFTRAATAEFAKKLNDSGLTALGGQPPKTMHGFALGILLTFNSSRIPYPLRIPDSWEAKNLIRPDVSRLLRANGHSAATPKVVRQLEDEMAADFQSMGGATLPMAAQNQTLVNAYRGVWEQHRRSYGYTLLSELPFQAAAVLEDLDEANLGLDLVIVDEYQDLNMADQRVLQSLAQRGIAIIAIGDDDQSIYGWRNAAPEGIRDFTTTFSTTDEYPLTLSHRCGGAALEVANALIEQDPGRPNKLRLAASEGAPNTEFRYLRFRDNTTEAEGVAAIIASRIRTGVNPSEVGVLVRSSADRWMQALQDAFDKHGVPVAPPVDLSAVLADRGVRKALAIGQLTRNLYDSLAWRALLKVTPGIGDAAVDYIYAAGGNTSFAGAVIELHARGLEGFAGRKRLTELADEVLAARQAVQDSAGSDGWGALLADVVGRDVFDPDALELFLAINDQVGIGDDLSSFLNELEPSLRELAANQINGVRVMTMGMSKGLTLNTVVVMGAEAGNIPSPRNNRAEELRLMYVALTRATDLTVVTQASRRTGPTARVGSGQVGAQRERSPFMTGLRGVVLGDGQLYVSQLS